MKVFHATKLLIVAAMALTLTSCEPRSLCDSGLQPEVPTPPTPTPTPSVSIPVPKSTLTISNANESIVLDAPIPYMHCYTFSSCFTSLPRDVVWNGSLASGTDFAAIVFYAGDGCTGNMQRYSGVEKNTLVRNPPNTYQSYALGKNYHTAFTPQILGYSSAC